MATGNSRNIIVGAATFAIGSWGSYELCDTADTIQSKIAENSVLDTPDASAPADLIDGWTGKGGSVETGDLFGGAELLLRNVGYTSEGVEINYQPEYGEVEVDQILDSAKIFKQSMSVNVSTTLAEATLENLLVAWDADPKYVNSGFGGNPPGTGGTGTSTFSDGSVYLSPGGLGDVPQERVLVFAGNGPLPSSDAACAPDGTGSGTPTQVTSSKPTQRVYACTRAVQMEASAHSLRRSEATVFPVNFRLLSDSKSQYAAYGKVVDYITP